MLRLLLSSSSNYQNLIRSKSISLNSNFLHTNPFNKQNLLNTLKNNEYKVKKIHLNTSKQSKNCGRISNILIGGTGIAITLGYRARKWLVCCEAVPVRLVSKYDKTKFDWRTFWKYLRPHFLKLLAAICAALAVAFFNIRIPSLLGNLVNSLQSYSSDAKHAAVDLLTMYLLQSGFTFLYILLLSQIGEEMAAKIRQDLFKQIIIQDLSFFDKNRTGELVNRLTADVQDFKSSFKQCISQGLRCVAQLIGGSISLYLISPQLAVVALVSVPTAVFLGSILGNSLRSLSRKSQAQSERATSVCEEALSNIRTVRSNAAENAEIRNFESETDLVAVYSQELGVGIAVFQAVTNLFLNGMVLTTLYLGGYLLSQESISPGQLMAFLVASQGVQRSLSQGSILLGTIIRGMTAGTRVFEYLTLKPIIDLKSGLTIPLNERKGHIEFKSVSFYYPSRTDQMVLKNFSLVIKPGETIAIVGSSGSGKSTIANLLERFYEPTGGSITIDGYNLNEISPNWLRGEAIGFIEQQPILFGKSILENIRYGKPDATDEEIFAAAKLSQSHEFVSALPQAYETNVGERGAQMSGGQRQRIAIARAILKQPVLLVMDEATSALDSQSESIVQEALNSVLKNRTTVVIAHRLSTIRDANVIIVLDQGHIVEMGTHNSLMQEKGHYYHLVRQQEKRSVAEDQLPHNRQSG